MFDKLLAGIALGLAVFLALTRHEEVSEIVNTLARDLSSLSTYGEVYIRFTGNGTDTGIRVSLVIDDDMDDIIRTACAAKPEVLKIAKNNPLTVKTICEPNNGARLYAGDGLRIMNSSQLIDAKYAYLVPQGCQFLWPLAEIGTVIYPKNVKSPILRKPITLTQLTMKPRVFALSNFATEKEISELLRKNKHRVESSQVGFVGYVDGGRERNSSTAWDYGSKSALAFVHRAFALTNVGFDPNMYDHIQVLRYRATEWYKPHLDAFDSHAFENAAPNENNGTNRFATILLYLEDVEEGGNTVFPLSTEHKGFDPNKRIVPPGTEQYRGYISESDARWACNLSSSALRSTTKRGDAVLFYSQGPDGAIDPFSLHGGCPPTKGEKWSANVWIYNRPKPDLDSDAVTVIFKHDRETDIEIFWINVEDESEVPMGVLESGTPFRMATYNGHKFVMKDNNGNIIFQYSAVALDNGKTIEF